MHTKNPASTSPARTPFRPAVALLALLALAAVATGCGQTDITKARIERAVAPRAEGPGQGRRLQLAVQARLRRRPKRAPGRQS